MVNAFRVLRRMAAFAAVAIRFGSAQVDLREASLEQLLNTKITSVSKKEQKLSQAAAAVFVINQDDIRRSGATNIPDLLRMAPGVEVAQINANRWAISIRGFNEAYSDKVLVLVDGRSVYSGTFSGVIWDMVSLPLEEIDRIEVVRGPGGSVWGANAVNGVINVVTKSSQDTKGGVVTAGGGTPITTDDAVRYGGNLGRKASYRVFGRYSRAAGFRTPGGADAGDGWDKKQAGFRSDWSLSPQTSLALQGDLFANHGSQPLTGSLFETAPGQLFDLGFFSRGGDLAARWKHRLAGGGDESLDVSYSYWNRLEQATEVSDRSFDIEYQNHLHLGRHDLVAGAGYRNDTGTLQPSGWISFVPPVNTNHLINGFLQDEIALSSRLWLTLGSKVEHNSYTGFEFEPTVRLSWATSPETTLWAAASRAIAQPAQYETSIQAIVGSIPIDGHTTALISMSGNPRLKAEELRDCELGFRHRLERKASLDLATFAGRYRNLISLDAQPAQVVPQPSGIQILLPTVIANGNRSLSYGGEATVNWDLIDRWRLRTSYALLEQSAPNVTPQFLPGGGLSSDATHTFQACSRLKLPGRLEFDQWVRWTSSLPANSVPPHTTVDVRLGRRLGESGEISLTGQNLSRPRFVEFGDSYGFAGTANPRSIFAKLTWYF